jgi:hypothetical protein
MGRQQSALLEQQRSPALPLALQPRLPTPLGISSASSALEMSRDEKRLFGGRLDV